MLLLAEGRWQDMRPWDLSFPPFLEETWRDFMKKRVKAIKLTKTFQHGPVPPQSSCSKDHSATSTWQR